MGFFTKTHLHACTIVLYNFKQDRTLGVSLHFSSTQDVKIKTYKKVIKNNGQDLSRIAK